MLTNLFESRNKMFLNLVKLGDYLGRSLRENVELFAVDNDTVTYLTESGYVVKGNFNNKSLKLTNIEIEDADIFEDKDLYSKLVDKKVSGFLADILENDLDRVEDSFGSILNIWESRLHFDRIKSRLIEKCERFNENLKITSTPEFERLNEMKEELIKFLKESNTFISIPEIRNTIKLSSVISSSFNLPKITYEELAESKSFQIPTTINHTLYDHLCKQELIAKELVEAKQSLETIWLTNDKIQKLPSYIYESDDKVMELVAEIVTEIPYFAISTKKQISNLIESNLDLLSDRNLVSQKDIKDYVSKIFEFKKPVKEYVLNILNEKYGINVQSLTDEPTFNSLIKTQILIFESLAKLSPKNSILKKVLYEFSETLKTKSGVESIDVSNFLNEVFQQAKYSKAINETQLMNYLNFDRVADDLGKIGQVLKMIQAGMGGGMAGGAPAAQPGMGGPSLGGGGMPQQMPPNEEGQNEPDGGDLAGMESMGGEDESGSPAMDAEDAAGEVAAEEGSEEEMAEDGIAPEEEELSPDEEEDVEFSEQDALVDNLKELESLIATLKDEIGVGYDEENEGGEEGDFGERAPESEDDIEFVDADSGESMGEDEKGFEGGGDEESDEGEEEESDEGEEDDSEDKEFPPKKK